MKEMVLCTDGILRVRYGVYDRARERHHTVDIPVPEPAEDNGRLFLSLLQRHVVIDSGLTLAELFRCLEPWSSLLSSIAWLDFSAFAREAFKPPPADLDDNLIRIEIRCAAEISSESPIEVEAEGGTPDDILERIPGSLSYTPKRCHRAPRRNTSDLRSLELSWSSCGIVRPGSRDDGAHEVSLMGAPMNELSHLPIVIVRDMDIWDHTQKHRTFFSPEPLLNPACPAVRQERPGLLRLHPQHLLAPPPNFFDAIVRGLLWDIGFFGGPDELDGKLEDIQVPVAEAEEKPDTNPAAPPDARKLLIRAEIAAEMAVDREADLREPFSERDQEVLRLAEAAARRQPDSVRYPSGIPTNQPSGDRSEG